MGPSSLCSPRPALPKPSSPQDPALTTLADTFPRLMTTNIRNVMQAIGGAYANPYSGETNCLLCKILKIL